jgi:hypothetical protein
MPNDVDLPDGSFVVSGRVYGKDRAGTGGLRVEVVDRNVAGDVALAETISDGPGRYTVSFSPETITRQGKSAPGLQVRVSHGATVRGASEVRHDATPQETLDVLLPNGATRPRAPLGSNYEVPAAAAVLPHLRNPMKTT